MFTITPEEVIIKIKESKYRNSFFIDNKGNKYYTYGFTSALYDQTHYRVSTTLPQESILLP